jgi:hypothetical protein
VILPHKLNPDKKWQKEITRSLTKQLFTIAQTLLSEDRAFLFLAQLLAIGIEQTKKLPGEIILAITDLLDCQILTPIKLNMLDVQQLTDQEIRTLRERVWAIPEKSDSEKEEILTQLSQMTPAERDVAIESLSHIITITTESTGEIIQAKKFENEAAARKEINQLDKEAKKFINEGNFDESIPLYEIAEVISYQWNLENLGKKYGNLVLSTTVNKHRKFLKIHSKLGKKYAKAKDYNRSFMEYKQALDAAHTLFKMGYVEVEDSIKILIKQTSAIMKLSDDYGGNTQYILKENLILLRKKLTSDYKISLKSKDILFRVEIVSKMMILSNHLFKFGIGNETSNIKKYRSDLESIKRKMNDLDEDLKIQIANLMEKMRDTKSQLMENAIKFEESEDWIKSLINYQQIMEIYYKMGDTDNAIRLTTKIDSLLSKVSDLYTMITYFSNESNRLRKEVGDEEKAAVFTLNARLLKSAIFLN